MTGAQLLLGLGLALAIAGLAYLARALSPGGALMAIVVGTITFGIGGMTSAVLLILFFVSSSILSRLGTRRKRSLAAAFAKGNRRDAWQVLANGIMATALSLAYGLTHQEAWLVGVAGALAAATADTWATELGVLSQRGPRLITTGARVAPGTSGGVSSLGLAASAGGASVIGLVGGLMGGGLWLAAMSALGGVAGSLIDSLLGATIQAIYWCPQCGKETERHPAHTCGSPTTRVRGWRWINNDAVNFAATLVGAALAVSLWLLVQPAR